MTVPVAERQNGKKVVQQAQPQALDGFQRKYLKRLVDQFDRARQEVTNLQNNANDFIVACAEDRGITIGQDGWTFDLDAFEFVCVPQQEGLADGDNS